jgi:hypothetical protein
MLGAVVLLAVQDVGIRITPLPVIRTNPQFEVDCTLRDLDFARDYRLTLSQTGGRYVRNAGDNFGAREPRYVQIGRDDLSIFGDKVIDLTGKPYTDWYSDGVISLGDLTIVKTIEGGRALPNPGRIAITARGGRYVRGGREPATLKEWTLVGRCTVAWHELKTFPDQRQEKAS